MTEREQLRPELPPDAPARILALPVDRGYPVPWFVQWVDDDGHGTDPGVGRPDFRVMDSRKLTHAVRFGACWICGGRLGAYAAFVLGPMCAVNRNSAEPPSHRDCAEWAARACPFLTRPTMRRREGDLPDGTTEPGGIMLRRNPAVALVWISRRWRPHNVRNPVTGAIDLLFDIGPPEETIWYREGRIATRAEILDSIEGGVPTLAELAEAEGPLAVIRLERQVARAMELLP